jgi:hypothetical protein
METLEMPVDHRFLDHLFFLLEEMVEREQVFLVPMLDLEQHVAFLLEVLVELVDLQTQQQEVLLKLVQVEVLEVLE